VNPFAVPADEGSTPSSSAYIENETPEVLYPLSAAWIPPEPGWLDQLRRCWTAAGLPVPMPGSSEPPDGGPDEPESRPRMEAYLADLDRVVRDELAELDLPGKIPPEKRTRVMSLKEAAGLMGYGAGKDGAKRLRAAIDAGSMQHEQLTRQQHVFSRDDFPDGVQGRITPPARSGPKSP
jgi:hypothetical protein